MSSNAFHTVLSTITTSPATAVFAFAVGWLICGALFDLALHRTRGVAAIRAVSFAIALVGATIGGWFSWARYRLWQFSDWADSPKSFPFPDALLFHWIEVLRISPPPGYFDIDSGFYETDLRLFAIVTVSWFVIGVFVGMAYPPRVLLAGVVWLRASIESRRRPTDS